MKGAAYEVHPGEAALVQRIFRLYVQERLSQEAIAAQLTSGKRPDACRPTPRVAAYTARAAVASVHRGAAMIGQLNSHGSTRFRCSRGWRARYDVVTPHTRCSIQARAIL